MVRGSNRNTSVPRLDSAEIQRMRKERRVFETEGKRHAAVSSLGLLVSCAVGNRHLRRAERHQQLCK